VHYRYIVYELVVETSFPCPLLPEAPEGVVVDVVVVEGRVPHKLDNPVAREPSWDATPGRFLFRGGKLAGRFLVEDGNRIILERNVEAEDSRLAVYFLASALTALLQQRGLLVLHANTALTARGALAVSGESGAGKTSTVAGIIARGGQLIADDITVLRLRDDNIIEVLPGPPHLHLCEDTADQFGFDIRDLPRFPWRRMKAALPVNGIMAQAPEPLKAIYLLKITDVKEVSCKYLSGMEKFDALQDCIYGPLLPDGHIELFSHLAAVAEQVDIGLVERPVYGWTLDEVVEVIMNG